MPVISPALHLRGLRARGLQRFCVSDRDLVSGLRGSVRAVVLLFLPNPESDRWQCFKDPLGQKLSRLQVVRFAPPGWSVEVQFGLWRVYD